MNHSFAWRRAVQALAWLAGSLSLSVGAGHAQNVPFEIGSTGQAAAPAQSGPVPAAVPAGAVGGMGDVNIYPKRLVIDGRNRLATLGLYNRSTAPGDYDITLSDKMMTPAGTLTDLADVTDPQQRANVHSAAQLLRWSPHRVMLQGSEAQTVRVMVRVPPDLPPGEYRSHFAIISVPPEIGGLSIDDAAGAERSPDGIGVRIVPRFGISIPVIVRVGETTLAVGIRDLAVVADTASRKIRLTLTRDGTRSAFGDIAIYPAGSKTPIAEVRGIGIYTEVTERRADVAIDPKADPRLYARGARLVAVYTDDDVAPGKALARQEFVVP